MGAYLFNGLDEWYENHKHEHTHIKKKSPIPMKETKKEKDWTIKKAIPANIHYGEQPKKGLDTIREYNVNGHTVKLYEDGNLSCACLGWIMKRQGVPRECKHVREIYGRLTHKPTPPKTIKPSKEELVFDALRKLLLED